ncbi:MAG: hypothetical protein ABI047_16700 [Jatrophihabitantaceae bacterium]
MLDLADERPVQPAEASQRFLDQPEVALRLADPPTELTVASA